MTKFYGNFYSDLPDQFVEATAAILTKWADAWRDKNRYYFRSRVIDAVPIDFIGNAKVNEWPTFKTSSAVMLKKWMDKHGEKYNGGYWESLTEDQRRPDRKPGDTGGDNMPNPSWFDPGFTFHTVTRSQPAKRPGLSVADIVAAQRMMSVMQSRIFLNLYDPFLDEARPPLKREGIVAGEILGYRCWRIECGLLRSVYQSDTWRPGQVLEGRELGDWDSRGIHAWKSGGSKEYHDYIRSYLNKSGRGDWLSLYEASNAMPAMVTGTVFLWGDVVEHERGYRAEFARVRSLDWLYPDATMMGREQQTLDDLRTRYAVRT